MTDRYSKKVNGALTEQYLYRDGYRIVAVKNGSGALLWRFVYATGRHVPDFAVDGAGALYWIVTDELGSLRMVIKASDASVKQSMRHDAWGKVVADQVAPLFTPVPFGFAGGLYDRDTGLVHFGAREYDPETGRWMTKDPIRFDGGDTNLYGYVGGDPINGVDPSGLWGFAFGLNMNVNLLLWGGEFSVGMLFDVSGSASGPFANYGHGPGFGLGGGLNGFGTLIWDDASKFRGSGSVLAADFPVPFTKLGGTAGANMDSTGQVIGATVGLGSGKGGDLHFYETECTP